MFFFLLYLFVELFPSNFKLAVFTLKQYTIRFFVLIATLFYWNRPKYSVFRFIGVLLKCMKLLPNHNK